MIGVAVIGCGYWGPNLIRNFSALEDADLVAICDRDPERMEGIRRRYPSVRCFTAADALLRDGGIDAVAIATPVETHFPLASAALEAGKHVLVEKPLTHRVDQAEALVASADARGLTLQVDHTFVYSAAVRKLRSIVESGEIGDLLYIDSVRINLGLFQTDVNVLWDLAAHDVSIMTYLLDRKPLWVSAVGSAHYGKLECQAYVTIQFSDALAHLHVNWLAPVKLRSTLIGGSKRMIVYDDLEPSDKIRIYEKGVTLNGDPLSRDQALVDYRVGDMHAPYIEKTEPLESSCRNFVESIEAGSRPIADGRAGLEVVRILAAAQESLNKSGERIWL